MVKTGDKCNVCEVGYILPSWYCDHCNSYSGEGAALVASKAEDGQTQKTLKTLLERLVANLADPYVWSWTRQGWDERSAADKVLRLMAKLDLIGFRQHPLGGDIWEINGRIYGRTDGVTPSVPDGPANQPAFPVNPSPAPTVTPSETEEEIAMATARHIIPKWHHPEHDAAARDAKRLILTAIRKAKAQATQGEATVSDLLTWLKARQGSSWLATIADVEHALREIQVTQTREEGDAPCSTSQTSVGASNAAPVVQSDSDAAHEGQITRYREALTEIAEGKGPFSRDPLTHASNTIDAMKELARQALEAPSVVPGNAAVADTGASVVGYFE